MVEPIETMKQLRQWIGYRLQPLDDGRIDKIPVDPTTGRNCNAHDPAVWQTCEQVRTAGYPTAFVFTADDPYFFLDVDECTGPQGEWNETAKYLCAVFAGCAMEISQSGRGLHIFGIAPEDVPHGTRCNTLHLEFYTSGRFCAVTEGGITGSADFMPDAALYRDFLGAYFPPRAARAEPTEANWTTEPVPEWCGPEDDDELIGRMLKSRSAKSIVGTGATVKHLWEADPDALGELYPDAAGNQGRAFDWSLADAALCQHLAFWTGKNCERMRRLWGRSALGQRDKFHNRPEYVMGTITRAASLCQKVYQDPKRKEPAEPMAPPDDSGLRAGFQFLAPQDQLTLFQGCVYIRDVHRVWTPDGDCLRAEQFRTAYGGYVFALDSISDKTTRNAWEAFTENQAVRFPWAHTACFRPELPAGQIVEAEGRRSVNTYVPIETERADGDPGLFLELVGRMLPYSNDRAILLAYMAACVQYPGVKFQWCPVVQGTFGNGKGWLAKVLTHCIGERYTHKVNPRDIDNVFNAWIVGNLLAIIDEVKTAGNNHVMETLKWLITDDRVPLQGKGADQTTGDNRANLFISTNHKDGIMKVRSDRRFAMLYTAQQCADDLRRDGLDTRFFLRLKEWLNGDGYAIINGFLRSYQIPDELNPAGGCIRAPETSSNEQAIQESFGPVAQEIIEAMNEGRPGFSGGWVSTMALNRLVESSRHNVTVNERKAILDDLGYIKHPALPDGRATRLIPAENGKPRLYVQTGHLAENITEPMAVMRKYCEAQGFPAVYEGTEVQNDATNRAR